MKVVSYRCQCGDTGGEIQYGYYDRLCLGCGEYLTKFSIKFPGQGFADNGGVDSLMKENHRWSDSMGCNPEEIPRNMKRFPNSTYHPHTGQLLIKNRHHKLKEMKSRGYVECDGYRKRKT